MEFILRRHLDRIAGLQTFKSAEIIERDYRTDRNIQLFRDSLQILFLPDRIFVVAESFLDRNLIQVLTEKYHCFPTGCGWCMKRRSGVLTTGGAQD